MSKNSYTYVANSRIRRKTQAIDYMGGKCEICGYNSIIYQSVFDFHHNDPNEKDFVIGDSKYKSWAETKKELDKCQLLCHNCHMLLHDSSKTIKTEKARRRSERMKAKKKLLAERKGGKCERCGKEFHDVFSIFTFYSEVNGKNPMSDYVEPLDELIGRLEEANFFCMNCRLEIEDEKYHLRRIERLKIAKPPEKPLLLKICPVCHQEFRTKDESRIYDKPKCASLQRRKVARPSKEELQRLILERHNWCAIARLYGVSDKAVRKWATGYGL